MKWLKGFGLLLIILVVAYLLGPSPKTPSLNTNLPAVTSDLVQLEQEITKQEKATPDIKPDNEARIIWADPSKKEKTPYSVVYIHGWSASQGEGDPIHREFAERYGCNLYLSRLAGHGIEGEKAMSAVEVEPLLESAKRAIAIGMELGKKVIVMSCSTGSTLSMYLASGNADIDALINYSPNVDLYDPNSFLLVKPWGLQMARLVTGSDYHTFEGGPGVQQYWTTKYKLDAVIQLKALINATMKESTFQNIKQPFFMGYYYKDEDNQDDVVSIPRMLEMFDQLGTPDELKRKVAMPNTGVHGLCSKYWSKDMDAVRKASFEFAEEVLGMVPAQELQEAVESVLVEE